MKITLETVDLPSTPVHVSGYVKLHTVMHNDQEYSQVFAPEGVAVFVINDRKEVLLVRVIRPSSGIISWEIPGGGIDVDETPREAAVREVQEETNFTLQPEKLLSLGHMYSDLSIISAKIHLFLQKVPTQRYITIKPDYDEILEAHWWSLREVEQAILANQIVESSTIIALGKARLMGVL